MTRWTGAWLPGTGSVDERRAGPDDRYRGERLGLPEHGRGSVASLGARLLAFLVDLVIAGLLASLFVRASIADVPAMQVQNLWGVAIWFVITVISVGFFGFTPGMALLGIRVARVRGSSAMVGPLRAIPRTLMIALLIPAVVWDRDGRGLHDLAVGTVVLRSR